MKRFALLSAGLMMSLPIWASALSLPADAASVTAGANVSSQATSTPSVIAPFRTGTLVKASSSSAVYVAIHGVLHHISAWKVFQEMGLNQKAIQVVPKILPQWAMGSSLSSGKTLMYTGALVKASNSSAVYVDDNNELYHIASYTLFTEMGETKADIITVPSISSLNIPVSTSAWIQPIPVDGTGALVKTPTNSTVYLVANGQLNPISSWAVFQQMGAQNSDILITE
ncbi:MAG: hypothetical protein OWS74_02245, partial [Firmicutes bacterium]|nr:hypothetical protein [Bacillota bacterium]